MITIFAVSANTGLATVCAIHLATRQALDSSARLPLDNMRGQATTAAWLQRLDVSLGQERKL
jgi:hypothetical protein